MRQKDSLITGQIKVNEEFELMSDKIVKYVVSVLFPAATLYVCWWLALEVSEIVAIFTFVLLGANYYSLMRKVGRSDK